MQLFKKIIGNTAVQVAGKFTTALIAVAVVKLLTIYLGRGGYGQYATIYEWLAFFGALADFGLFAICVREMAKGGAQRVFGTMITLRLVLVTAAMALAASTVWLVPVYRETVVASGVAVGALLTWLVIVAGTFSAALQYKLQMHWSAIALVIGKILGAGLICLVIFRQFPDDPTAGFFPLLWAGVAGGVLTLLLTIITAARHFSVRPLFDWQRARQLLVMSAPLAVALIFYTLYLRVDIFLLSTLLPQSDNGVCAVQFCADTQVGMYAVAARLVEIALLTPIFFLNAALPSLSSLPHGSGRARNLLAGSLHALLVLGLLAGGAAFLLRESIVLIIANPDFLGGSDTALALLAPMLPLAFVNAFFAYAFIASGQQKWLIVTSGCAVTLNFIGNWWLIPSHGLLGAAAVSLAAEAGLAVLLGVLSWRLLGLRIEWGSVALIVAVAGAAVLLTSAVRTTAALPLAADFALTVVLLSGSFALLLTGSGVLRRELARWRLV